MSEEFKGNGNSKLIRGPTFLGMLGWLVLLYSPFWVTALLALWESNR